MASAPYAPCLDSTDVYLIHTMPTDNWLARYRRFGAEITTVDPGEQAVRVRAMRSSAMERVVTARGLVTRRHPYRPHVWGCTTFCGVRQSGEGNPRGCGEQLWRTRDCGGVRKRWPPHW